MKKMIDGRTLFRLTIILLFLCNSFAGWLVLTFVIFKNSDIRKKEKNFWAILSIVFISLYNATKIPENDLEWYSDFYLLAGHYQLKDYLILLNGAKEPIYQCFVYFLYLIGGDNIHFFIFAISLTSYYFMLLAVKGFCKLLNLSSFVYVVVISVLCFFPYTYALSVHIIRQFLAASVLSYLLMKYYSTNNRKYAIISVFTIFIHSSVVFFMPFLFFKKITDRIGKRSILIYIVIAVLFASISSIAAMFLPYLINDSTVLHIANKAINGTTFETELPLYQFIASIIMILCSIFCIYITPTKFLRNMTVPNYIVNISIFIILFIIANSKNPEIQLRYNFYLWSFVSLYSAIILKRFRFSNSIYGITVIGLFVFWVFYNNNMSQWTYTCCDKFYYYPFYYYFVQ